MEGIIGEIRLFAGDYAPRGWAFCDGQLLNIADNTALFSIIGSKYGGDGRTNFALPKLADLNSTDGDPYNDINYMICLEGYYPARY